MMVTMGAHVRILLCLLALLGQVDAVEVPLDKVPPAVWKAVQGCTGGTSPLKVERLEQDGEVLFHATFKSITGGEQNALVAQDGTMLGLEVPLTDVPAPARKTIETQVGGGKITAIDKQSEADGSSFDVAFVNTAGDERTLSVDQDGTLLSRQIALAEAPDEVRRAVNARIKGGKLHGIEQVYGEDEVVYDVDFTTKKGREVSCTFAASGREVSVDMAVEDLPAPVRSTVADKVGGGKVMRVSKIVNAKHLPVRYEVQSVVNGKALDFSVGPKGKFMGVDE